MTALVSTCWAYGRHTKFTGHAVASLRDYLYLIVKRWVDWVASQRMGTLLGFGIAFGGGFIVYAENDEHTPQPWTTA